MVVVILGPDYAVYLRNRCGQRKDGLSENGIAGILLTQPIGSAKLRQGEVI